VTSNGGFAGTATGLFTALTAGSAGTSLAGGTGGTGSYSGLGMGVGQKGSGTTGGAGGSGFAPGGWFIAASFWWRLQEFGVRLSLALTFAFLNVICIVGGGGGYGGQE
jgi:hypothetical protein